jgi:hypothetical protein
MDGVWMGEVLSLAGDSRRDESLGSLSGDQWGQEAI